MFRLSQEEIIFAVISIGNGKFVSLSDYPLKDSYLRYNSTKSTYFHEIRILHKLNIHSTPIFNSFLLIFSSSYLTVVVFECLTQKMWFINSTLDYSSGHERALSFCSVRLYLGYIPYLNFLSAMSVFLFSIGSAYSTKPVLCNSILVHKTLPFFLWIFIKIAGQYTTCSVNIYITLIQHKFEISGQG